MEVCPSTIENTFVLGRKRWEISPNYDQDELDTISLTAVALYLLSDYVRGEKTSSWCFLDQVLPSGEKEKSCRFSRWFKMASGIPQPVPLVPGIESSDH